MRGALGLAALLLAPLALAGPMEEFAKVVESYVGADSYASRFEIEATKVEEGRLRPWRVKGEMAYVAPNKFLLRMEDPVGGFVVACDGARVVSYIWPHMEYRVDPAPRSLKEFRADPLLGLPARGPLVWQLLCAKSVKAILGDVKSVRESSEDGMVVYEVRTALKGKGAEAAGRFTFKVDRRERAIREIVAEISVADKKGRITAYVIREVHRRIRKGGRIEANFRFSPPKGARRVKEFSPPYP